MFIYGICAYINDRWCNNIKIHKKVCMPDIEMLSLTLRLFLPQREFPTLVFTSSSPSNSSWRFLPGGSVLDLCYGNVNNAHSASVRPPLDSSDHNIIFLLPQYTQTLKRYRPNTYCAFQWSEDITATLHGSLACTDWSVFDEDNLNMKIEVISDYIKFCMTTTIPAIAVKNSRLWMTSQIKLMLK